MHSADCVTEAACCHGEPTVLPAASCSAGRAGDREWPASSLPSGESGHSHALPEADCHVCVASTTDTTSFPPPVDGDLTVTCLIPTMFTTACGRAICVREERSMHRGSPEWHLWHQLRSDASACAGTGLFCVSHEADAEGNRERVAAHTTTACCTSTYFPHFQPPWRQRAQPTPLPPTQTNAHDVSDHGVSSRCRSCPAVPSDACSRREEARRGEEITVHAHYSGFTRADGSMIFLR